MTIGEIIKLLDAGYTKEDIDKMQLGEVPAPKPEQTPKLEPEQTPKPEPKADPAPANTQTVTLTSAQLSELVQGIAVKTASGDIEVPGSLDDKLSAHLESILKGD